MLVNSNDLLSKALKEGYAIPAYNINNLEWTKYILEACSEDKSPVILAVTEKSANYCGGYKVIYNMVKNLMDSLNIKVPVVLHLDHGSSFESCKEAINAGFTSVMLDKSKENLEENISETNKVIDYANLKNVSVEAEVGAMNEEENHSDANIGYANLEDVKTFVLQTGVNSLAPAIGNKHGVYKGEAKIDFELLGAICKETKIPIVLHGASGLDENKIRTAIFCGVCKININTDLQIAWSKGVRSFLEYDKDVYDPRTIIGSGEKSIKSLIHEKNNLFGSKNRAI